MIAEKFRQMSKEIVYPREDSNDDEAILIKKLQREIADTIELRRTKYRKLRLEYQKKQIEIDEEFKIALFVEYNMMNHPNREKIFSKAWEDGHANGYEWVEVKFEELVELLT